MPSGVNWNGVHFLLQKWNSKKQGQRNKSKLPENISSSPASIPKMKERQTFWQKASSLRQSFRHSSKSKGGQKSPQQSQTDEANSVGKTVDQRDFALQRNIARERRSLVAKHIAGDELTTVRSLHSRSLCIDFDSEGLIGPALSSKQQRPPRKLTKDSGYETTAQCDPENSDWLTGLDNRVLETEPLAWNSRHRPLSFSHQEVVTDRGKRRQLRHSYSQREVSRNLTHSSIDSPKKSSPAPSVDVVGTWPNNPASFSKSVPSLCQHSTINSRKSEFNEGEESSMVTRRFKKGSVYDALASTSGLDFSPVVQLKAYNSRNQSVQNPKPEKVIENPKHVRGNSSLSNVSSCVKSESSSIPRENPYKDISSSSQDSNCSLPKYAKERNEIQKCIAAHEKYPSWPVTSTVPATGTHRSHSWTGQTDYPKEKVAYSRPQKIHQFKIATEHLQPVLERACDYNINRSPAESSCSATKGASENFNLQYNTRNNSFDRSSNPRSFSLAFPCNSSSDRRYSSESFSLPYSSNSSTHNFKEQQFDFEAFHTPCIPHCYEEKDRRNHSPAEKDIPAAASASFRSPHESVSSDSNGFLNRYEEVLQCQAQYSEPLSPDYSKQQNGESKGETAATETPFLDRLRLENSWQVPPPPAPMMPVADSQEPQPLHPQGNDFELSSENGTWMGSMESSSHGRSIPKWQGSYSDLSTLSTQLSNRSSLFDSGNSTMPESGRLSPQSSCGSAAPSLLLEAPTRAQVIARHGCHREIVAHSARVQKPQRHGSESVLYYSGSSRSNGDAKYPFKNVDFPVKGNSMDADEALFRSQITLSLSNPKSNSNDTSDYKSKNAKFSSKQDLRKPFSSFSHEETYPHTRCYGEDDTSGSSSDISNITCISNYRDSLKSKRLTESQELDILKSKNIDQSKYRSRCEPPKSKSLDETTQKLMFPDIEKKQRISDPQLKAIQKQAVMSFYQRMSLTQSIKSDHFSLQSSVYDAEPPPPYEASDPSRLKIYQPQKPASTQKKFDNQWEPRSSTQPLSNSYAHTTNSLQDRHSKSVPNLVVLKGQSLDLPPSHPIFKQTYNASKWNTCNNGTPQMEKTRGSPLEKEEIISWDQLSNVLEKKREAVEKAAPSNENKDPPDDNASCSSGMHYFKSHKSPRKVQLKEVHHSNDTASVKVMTPDGVTLVRTHERKEDKSAGARNPPHKRRPAPPPPPKQPPKRPPPPPPPVTPPPPQVVVVLHGAEAENDHLENKLGDLQITQLSSSSPQLNACSVPSCCIEACCSDLPPPPAAEINEEIMSSDEPLPPPPDPHDIDLQPRVLDSSSLIYPKNSYMSYRSERKIGRQGFDGKYRRLFKTSASSMDLTTLSSSFQDGKDGQSLYNSEHYHDMNYSTVVSSHSDHLQSNNHFQRNSSQDLLPSDDLLSSESDNTSNNNLQKVESSQSSNSISSQSLDMQDVHLKSVPCQSTSQENVACEFKHVLLDKLQNVSSTKVVTSESSDDIVINCEPINEAMPFVNSGNSADTSVNIGNDKNNLNVDYNQNDVTIDKNEDSNFKIINENDLNNRINCATQTTDTPKLQRKYSKTKEELECERLSMDFINHYGDVTLKNLLVPTPNCKTMSDYMEGLLNLEIDMNPHSNVRCRVQNFQRTENQKSEEISAHQDKCVSFDSNLQNNHSLEVNENAAVNSESELKKKKEELMNSIGKKVAALRAEQTNIKEKMRQNELLGKKIFKRLQKVAKPNEVEKYSLHVEEIEKIVNLLLSLSGRLAKSENILKNMPKEGNPEEKKILEAKRDKLREQHEDARRLKESIDRRSCQVSTFLHKYFSEDEYADYDQFIKMKTKLIVDIREIDEKINLSEEQLAALSVVAHLWKSANS